MALPKLTIVLPTDAKLEESEDSGILTRWQFYFSEISKHFEVEAYSCDTRDYSDKLTVKHCHLPFSMHFLPYGNQIFYNVYLLLKASSMSKNIRIIGATYFILPLLKLFFRNNIILAYHYDYATTTMKDHGGIKGYTAGFREWTSLKSADIITYTSPELCSKIKNSDTCIVIPNFVDTSKFVPLEKDNFILYAGRIHWHKGMDYLLEAFDEIEKIFPIGLKLAGKGDISFYKEKILKSGTKNVEFLGVIDNSTMPSLMGKAKIFILPSVNREGHPVALVEAMASGCACIATDVPGNRELIQHGINGLLVKPKNSHSIAGAIKSILDDDAIMRSLCTNAIITSKKFSIDNTLKREIELLKSI